MSGRTSLLELERARASSLPSDVLADASRRLGRVALLYSATFFVAYFGGHLGGWAAGRELSHVLERPVQLAAALASILAGLAMFSIARRGAIPARRLLDLGLVFWVLGALGIAMAEFWGSRLVWDPNGFTGLSWVAIWILVFPVIAPSAPWKILVAALLAASMPPLVFGIAHLVGSSRWEGLSVPMAAVYFAVTTYLCAAMAYVVARVIHRFGRQIREARAVGSYRLLERLGVGGMGEVWRAEHRLLAKPAAVKLIRPEVLASAGLGGNPRERFEREAQATALLRSVHTIELYDFGVAEDGSFFYVMELLDGVGLERLVAEDGPQSPGRTIHILRQVCRSLDEAHAAGMVHRDIKPANIFLCRFGADVDFVKVLDFGLVKAVGARELGDPDLTGSARVAGTPAYAAPEMVQGEEVDGRADLYSLGCVAYWLLTGTPVFRSTSPMALLVDHVKETPEPPSRRVDRPIPPDLEAIVLGCLAKDPEQRHPSAAALERALAECRDAPSWLRSHALAWWAGRPAAGAS